MAFIQTAMAIYWTVDTYLENPVMDMLHPEMDVKKKNMYLGNSSLMFETADVDFMMFCF